MKNAINCIAVLALAASAFACDRRQDVPSRTETTGAQTPSTAGTETAATQQDPQQPSGGGMGTGAGAGAAGGAGTAGRESDRISNTGSAADRDRNVGLGAGAGGSMTSQPGGTST